MDSTLALTTVVVAVGSTEAKLLVTKKPLAMKPVIAGFILGIFLYAFMAVNSDLASKFCYLIIVSALLINGAPVAKALTPKGK